MRFFGIFLLTCSVLVAGVFDFKTISSEFEQTITNEEGSIISYRGKFYASIDSKALWIYKSPVEKRIYFNQNQVVIVEPQLEQVIITNLQNTPNLTEILRGAKNIDTNIYEATYGDTKYIIYIKNGKIDTISYSDRLDNRISIRLFNQATDIFLDNHLFNPTIPSGFDIIR